MGGVPSKAGDSSTTKLQVIGAGFSRTGTTSMQLALEKLLDGPVLHGGTHFFEREDAFCKKWIYAFRARHAGDKETTLKLVRDVTAGFVGTTDSPTIFFVEEMMELYPEAKVVVVTRDPKKWWESMENLLGAATPWWVRGLMSPIPGWRWANCVNDEFRLYAKQLGVTPGPGFLLAWNQHIIEKVPKDRLLVFDLKDGWEPLCDFLGKPIPKEAFPHANDAEALNQYAVKVFGKLLLYWTGFLSLFGITAYIGVKLLRGFTIV